MRDHAIALFAHTFGASPSLVVRAPGRVNLIGDHTDYNEGFVLPMAIERATWVAASPRDDTDVRLISEAAGRAELDLLKLEATGEWSDYVAGTLWAMAPPAPVGFDAAIVSDVPVGSGLSSSAALELGVSRVAHALSEVPWDPVGAALEAQRAENHFVGVPTGIMDQLIVATAREGHLSLIDCRDLSVETVPLPEGAVVVILDTGTRRGLVDSEYEARRAACERVAGRLGITALRDASLEAVERAPIDETDRLRARHVITENMRTVQAAERLRHLDAAAVGALMNESHASLRDWFGTSSPALDAMVEIAGSHHACFGARVTGAGFAGAAVALVAEDAVSDFCRSVARIYDQQTAHRSALYVTKAAGGVEIL